MTRIGGLGLVVIASILVSLCLHVSLVNGAAVMSVDLGNEWMKVGVVSPGVPMEIALNKESKRKTASVVAFRDGVRYFGEDAQNIGVRFPQNSYGYLVDLLGKTVDNPMVELYKQRFPYYTIEADPHRKTVVFRNGDETFSVEELVAQLLQKAKQFAEETTGQPITECVIITPGYFGQAERSALLAAAALADLKVLQLMNDYTAVSLNYGIFRRKEMNESAQYFIFYDMGAQKTSAAVISYQLVKDKATKEINPVIAVLGVGYDRNLGGLEMQLRLRDHLAREFNAMKKTPTDVFTNARAMAKLFKEAGRVKNVLSANADHYAQIEGLLDDKDFKVQVTREQFENLCEDLFERVPGVIERALASSGLTMDVISQVTMFGGSTRVPKIQEILKQKIKQELGKNLNADEAATMGGAYKAADLATGFKVKKFITKDAVIFPIQVVFEREGDSGNVKQIRRSLFGPMNPYPQKKVITFNKHTTDFNFDVNYADLDYLPKDELKYLGSLNLTRIALTQVEKVLAANKGENIESKGIKAHFVLDDSGIFYLSGVELVVEKTVKEEEEESPLSKLGSTISKLFSSDKDTKDEKVEETKEEEKEVPEREKSDDKENKNSTTKGNETASGADAEATGKNHTDKPKVVVIKEPIPSEIVSLFTVSLDGDQYKASKKKIDELDDQERQRTRRETALNALESFVIDANQRLNQEEYSKCANEKEIEAIQKACADVSDWLYEDGSDADATTYEAKLLDLKKLTNEIYSRHWEHSERPEALKALEGMIDGSTKFLQSAKNLTKEVNPEKDVFTPVEIETLERIIKETTEWRDNEVKEQGKLKPNEPVRLTVKSLTEKMALLDREVKYLVNKLKIWKPKVKENKNKDKKTDANETVEGDGDAAKDGQDQPEQTEEQVEEPVTNDEDILPVEATEPTGEEAQTPHGEL